MSFSDVETEVIPDGGNPDWLYNQNEPVLCSVEEYGEPAFPSYSTIEGSDGVRAFFIFTCVDFMNLLQLVSVRRVLTIVFDNRKIFTIASEVSFRFIIKHNRKYTDNSI